MLSFKTKYTQKMNHSFDYDPTKQAIFKLLQVFNSLINYSFLEGSDKMGKNFIKKSRYFKHNFVLKSNCVCSFIKQIANLISKSELHHFVPRLSARPLEMCLHRPVWIRLNCLGNGMERFQSSMHK